MDNTSIAAVTLPNENRHVYFQESTGAFRRAIYSSQAKIWQASADAQVVPDAKNNTPLAGIFDNRVVSISPPNFIRCNLRYTQSVYLFYVNADHRLRCVAWAQTYFDMFCPPLEDHQNLTVAQESRHISATLAKADFSQPCIILTYQNSSGELIIMLGNTTKTAPGYDGPWNWSNVPFRWELYPKAQIVTACSGLGSSFNLWCFTKYNQTSTSPIDGLVQMNVAASALSGNLSPLLILRNIYFYGLVYD